MKEFNKENVQIILAENELDYEQSAMILTVNDPWAKLGRTYEYSFAKVHEEDGELFVAKDEDRVVGCLLLEMHSTLKAFVRALCVSSENRGRGVGADLLAFAEHRAFKETANVFLFVSLEYTSGSCGKRLARQMKSVEYSEKSCCNCNGSFSLEI